MMLYRTVAALGLVVEIAAHQPLAGGWQTLGHAPLQLMGVLFGVAFVLSEWQEAIQDFVSNLRQRWRSRFRDERDEP